jgi:ribonuclease R
LSYDLLRHLKKNKYLGYVQQLDRGGRATISSCNYRQQHRSFNIQLESSKQNQVGDVVLLNLGPSKDFRVCETVGRIDDPSIYSTLGILEYGIQENFSQEAMELAEKACVPDIGVDRTDLRHIDFITIDGDHAKDFDDAVWGCVDQDPSNDGGYCLFVAIADVSHYVHEGDIIDEEAMARGNSIYLVDRSIPMLPKRLTNDICCLRPEVDRACMVAQLHITPQGDIKKYRFYRGLMRSRARLTYDQVQNAIDGHFDELTDQLWQKTIKPLYDVYKILEKNRKRRHTIDLSTTEYVVNFDRRLGIKDVLLKERMQSNKLIEECMIAANVAAADFIDHYRIGGIFRIHDLPSLDRLKYLKLVFGQFDLSFKPKNKNSYLDFFEHIIDMSKNHEGLSFLAQHLVIRSQARALYAPVNIGHFGLNLSLYTHFTSPIRRYSDLVVHRLIGHILDYEHNKGSQKVCPPLYSFSYLKKLSNHLNECEHLADQVSRIVEKRFLMYYFQQQNINHLKGIISKVNERGLIIHLTDYGIEGLVERTDLERQWKTSFYLDYCSYLSEEKKIEFRIGDHVDVTIKNINCHNCGLLFQILLKLG